MSWDLETAFGYSREALVSFGTGDASASHVCASPSWVEPQGRASLAGPGSQRSSHEGQGALLFSSGNFIASQGYIWDFRDVQKEDGALEGVFRQ